MAKRSENSPFDPDEVKKDKAGKWWHGGQGPFKLKKDAVAHVETMIRNYEERIRVSDAERALRISAKKNSRTKKTD